MTWKAADCPTDGGEVNYYFDIMTATKIKMLATGSMLPVATMQLKHTSGGWLNSRREDNFFIFELNQANWLNPLGNIDLAAEIEVKMTSRMCAHDCSPLQSS